MHLKEILAVYSSQLLSKKTHGLKFDPKTNGISYSECSKGTDCNGSETFNESLRKYKVDKILEVGNESFSKYHQQLFTNNCLKNLNVYLIGNNDQLKQKCIFGELRFGSIVKQLLKKLVEHSKRVYVTIQTSNDFSEKEALSSYADFIAIYNQFKATNQKYIRLLFQYTIDAVVYSTNIIKLPHNLKEVSQIYRLKDTNKTVIKLCSKDKNNLFYLCLDKNKQESQEYLMMMASTSLSRPVLTDINSKSRSSSKNRLKSSNSVCVSAKKTEKTERTERTQKIQKLQKNQLSELWRKKENLGKQYKQQIRTKVTQKILIDKNRKLDQMTKLLQNRDIQVQQLKLRIKKLQQQLSASNDQLDFSKKQQNTIKGKYSYMIEQLERQLKTQSESSCERYKQYQDRIQELEAEVQKLKRLDAITLQKFGQLSKQKFTAFGKQINQLKQSNKQLSEKSKFYEKQIKGVNTKYQTFEKQNGALKQLVKSQETELAKTTMKYSELNSKLKSLLNIE